MGKWAFRRKVVVTMLFGFTTMCSTFASSVFSPTTSFVARQYGISTEVAILGVSLFVAGYIPGPVIFAPLSEVRLQIHPFAFYAWNSFSPPILVDVWPPNQCSLADVCLHMLQRGYSYCRKPSNHLHYALLCWLLCEQSRYDCRRRSCGPFRPKGARDCCCVLLTCGR
jgi:hypothetical protein